MNIAPSSISRVESLYHLIKEKVVSFQIKPGDRINEVELAKNLKASRTPLREALNRLVAEEIIAFYPGRGFFCKELNPRIAVELYQLRSVLEVAAIRLACDQATEQELDELTTFLTESRQDVDNKSMGEMIELDEEFHFRLMALSRNSEMARVLANVNDRIRFFRYVYVEERRNLTPQKDEHFHILEALKSRNSDLAAEHVRNHISKRQDQITAAMTDDFSHMEM